MTNEASSMSCLYYLISHHVLCTTYTVCSGIMGVKEKLSVNYGNGKWNKTEDREDGKRFLTHFPQLVSGLLVLLASSGILRTQPYMGFRFFLRSFWHLAAGREYNCSSESLLLIKKTLVSKDCTRPIREMGVTLQWEAQDLQRHSGVFCILLWVWIFAFLNSCIFCIKQCMLYVTEEENNFG